MADNLVAALSYAVANLRIIFVQEGESRPRLFEQNSRVDKWSVCRGYAATGRSSGLK
jgi:hypothetical protein